MTEAETASEILFFLAKTRKLKMSNVCASLMTHLYKKNLLHHGKKLINPATPTTFLTNE
jgi:predicted transcriptional regulator